jgi:hypothetical protein
MASNYPPRLLGPGPDSARNARLDTPRLQQAIDAVSEVRVYQVEVTNLGAGTVVSHDLREAIIPLCQALGTTNRVAVLSVAEGRAVVRNVGGVAPCQCVVRFERITRQ